jgi:hypothetical protein
MDDRGLHAMIVESIAGGGALEEFGDGEPWAGADNDLRHARAVAGMVDAKGSQAVYDAATARARELCRTHRTAIERFAEALDASGRLAGSEVREAVRAAMAGWTWTREAAYAWTVRRRALFESEDLAGMAAGDVAAAWRRAGRRSDEVAARASGPTSRR